MTTTPPEDFSVEQQAAVFEAELAPLLRPALRLAGSLLLDVTAAEDAVQEAALKAWRSRSNRRTGTELRPWFLAIVVNQCRDWRRGRWVRMHVVGAPPEDVPQQEDREVLLDLRQAVSRLPRRTRVTILLRYYLDLPVAEVAAITGGSIEATKSRLRRGLDALNTALTPLEDRS